MNKHKIGVFDSGAGGKSVANEIAKTLDKLEVVYANDRKHIPYGDKPIELVYSYVLPILKQLEKDGCEIIVIACNTVTTTLISKIRENIKVPVIGMEPMVKAAAERTRTGIIAVCATPATLASERYDWLKKTYASHVSIIEPDCSNWARMIESNDVDHEFINKQIDDACNQKADVIVLGCTHYHWIEEDIRKIAAGRALVMQPAQSVIRRIVRTIEELEETK